MSTDCSDKVWHLLMTSSVTSGRDLNADVNLVTVAIETVEQPLWLKLLPSLSQQLTFFQNHFDLFLCHVNTKWKTTGTAQYFFTDVCVCVCVCVYTYIYIYIYIYVNMCTCDTLWNISLPWSNCHVFIRSLHTEVPQHLTIIHCRF